MLMPTGDVSSKDRELEMQGVRAAGSLCGAPTLTTLDRAVPAPAERLQEDISSHHVNGYVDAAACQLLHRILQAALAVVHAGLCSPLHRQLALLVTSSGSYDLSEKR